MTKNTKIILILLVIAVVLILYFALSSEKVVIFNSEINKNAEATKIIQEEIRESYTEKINKFFVDIEFLNVSELSIKNIMIMKDQLLGLIVPEEYKEFHLDLVLTIDELSKKLEAEEPIEKEFESIKSMRGSL